MNRHSRGLAAIILVGLGALSAGITGCGKAQLSEAEHMQRAQQALDKGEVRAAIIDFKNVLQANPANADARYLLGGLYVDLADGASAEKELRSAAENGKPAEDIYVPLAEAMVLQGKYQDALDALAEHTARDSAEQAHMLALGAEAYLGLKRPEVAAKRIEEALRVDPNSLRAYLAAIKASLEAGDFDRASELVDNAKPLGEQDGEYWRLAGALDLLRGQPADAEDWLRRSLELEPAGLLGPRAYQTRVQLAMALLQQNKEEEALTEVKALLKANDKHPTANYLRGAIAYEEKQYDEALPYLQQANTSAPSEPRALLLLGSTHFALGNYQQAELYLSNLVAAYPGFIPAQRALAATRFRLGQSDQALEGLIAAAETNPNDAELLRIIGAEALRAGDVRRGQDYLRQAAAKEGASPTLRTQLAAAYLAGSDYEPAIKELEQAIAAGKDASEAETLLVIAHIRKGDLVSAEAAAKDIIQKRPDDPKGYNLLGSVHLARRDAASARAQFDEALKRNPDFVPALLNLARLDYADGNAESCKSRLQQAVAIEPTNVSAFMTLASLEQEAGNDQGAIQWLEKARAANKTAVEPRVGLARYYLRTGDSARAQQVAAEALSLAPESPEVLRVNAKAQVASGRQQDAISTLEKLITLEPDSVDSYMTLAKLQAQVRQTTAAKRTLRRALDVRPGYYPAMLGLAQLEVAAGDYAAALALADEMKKRQPDSPAGYALAGDVLMHAGRHAEAAEAYRAANERGANGLLAIRQFEALRHVESPNKAVVPLTAWLEENPDDARVRAVLGDAYAASGDAKNAAAQYEIVLKHRPEDASTLNNLALQYSQLNDPRALETAESAYALQPNDPNVADTLGWILTERGKDLNRAVSLLRTANRQASSPELQYHLASALAKQGNEDEARVLLDQALKSQQPFPGRSDAERLRGDLH